MSYEAQDRADATAQFTIEPTSKSGSTTDHDMCGAPADSNQSAGTDTTGDKAGVTTADQDMDDAPPDSADSNGGVFKDQKRVKRERSVDEKFEADGHKRKRRIEEHRKEIESEKARKKEEDERRFQNKQASKKQNIKSSYESLPETDDHDEIRRQVEFYFSDANLPTDKYLLGATGGHENKPFPLKELHTFKRMQRFQPYSAVVAAIKDSKILNLDNEGGVTRKEPLSDEYTDDIDDNKEIHARKTEQNSIYAKGFGHETKSTQIDIERFFGQYGTVKSVRLRRRLDNLFKGSAIIEFDNKDTAQAFLDLDNKPKWQGKTDLLYMTLVDWFAEKREQAQERQLRRERSEAHGIGRGPNGERRGRGEDGRGGRSYKKGLVKVQQVKEERRKASEAEKKARKDARGGDSSESEDEFMGMDLDDLEEGDRATAERRGLKRMRKRAREELANTTERSAKKAKK